MAESKDHLEEVDALDRLPCIQDLHAIILHIEDGQLLPESSASRFARVVTIFLLKGAISVRLKLLGLSGGGNKESPTYILAHEADLARNGTEYDERFEAVDAIGRPKWAKGAVVLLSSRDAAVLHRHLVDLGIVLDSRYLVCPKVLARSVFLAMAHAAAEESNPTYPKRLVNGLRSVTLNLDDLVFWEDVSRQVRVAAAKVSDEAFSSDVRWRMDKVIKDVSSAWYYDFDGLSPILSGASRIGPLVEVEVAYSKHMGKEWREVIWDCGSNTSEDWRSSVWHEDCAAWSAGSWSGDHSSWRDKSFWRRVRSSREKRVRQENSVSWKEQSCAWNSQVWWSNGRWWQ